MSTPSQYNVRNRLLRAMSPDDFSRLQPALLPVTMPKGLGVSAAGETLTSVLFPESGLISIVNNLANGRQIEVGIFGREGMGSTAVVLGAGTIPFTTFVQIAGEGHTVETAPLLEMLATSPEFQGLMMRYCQAFMIQVAQTAVSNGTFTIEQRLARWLLLVHDRMETDEVPLTHEFLSIMLGVRRTGVTLAIHVLEGERTIRARRGVITMLDRDKLKAIAAEGYGMAEAEYERLVGPLH